MEMWEMKLFEALITEVRAHRVTNCKCWVFTLGRNQCLMDLRSANRIHTVYIDDHLVESDTFLHQYHNGEGIPEEQLTLMESCLETLNAEQQTCVRLFYLEQK